MPKDSRVVTNGALKYLWNPFQDIVANRVTGEQAHIEGGTSTIIVPRVGPFFSRDFKIKLKGSGRELSLEKGEYSFLYPFGSFIEKYSRLVYGGIQVFNVGQPSDFILEYDTIGDKFVLDDVAYAEFVANTLTSPRTIDYGNIINVPKEFPPDPHEHPASDTMNYKDLVVYMKSYIDAITNTDSSFSSLALITKHLDADLQHAHKATLADLGLKNLQDWAMAAQKDLMGNSTELLMNVAMVKEVIRMYERGEWR